jgi:hypothetical protein
MGLSGRVKRLSDRLAGLVGSEPAPVRTWTIEIQAGDEEPPLPDEFQDGDRVIVVEVPPGVDLGGGDPTPTWCPATVG